MHGANEKVLATGLSVDYAQVSARAERLRGALTRAQSARMQWGVRGREVALDIPLNGQEAQKSHGLVRTKGDIANLPAGEVYFVPAGAEGVMPMKFEDEAGTIALFRVKDRGIVALEEIVQGDRGEAERFLESSATTNAGQITGSASGRSRCRGRAPTSRTRRSSERRTSRRAAATTWAARSGRRASATSGTRSTTTSCTRR
jgi:hypothetical protein